jgi:hypothetical protein
MDLRPTEAICTWRVSDFALKNGDWPIIGDSGKWDRENWPIPDFVCKPEFSRVGWRIVYSDDNPNIVVGRERLLGETAGLDFDCLHGDKAAQMDLSTMIT